MKAIMAIIVAALTFITGLFAVVFKPEPAPENPSETITQEAAEEESLLDLVNEVVTIFKNDMPEFLETLNKIKDAEDFKTIEKEANEFLNTTINEIQKKLPEDFKIEVDNFDVEKISDIQMNSIKEECRKSDKFNADKISTGFSASGKAVLTANGKTYALDGSAIIICVDGSWVLYDFNYGIPDDFNIKDLLK